MSVHIRGIGPDGQWLTKAERDDMRHEFMPAVEATPDDALARLEAWVDAHTTPTRFVAVVIDRGKCMYCVKIRTLDGDGRTGRSVAAHETMLSAAIHAALDQWEATQ